jgi:phosphoribosylamine--glycine ligase
MISTIMIGNGGREDSLRWKLEKENIPINENSKFVIIGPEGPIADGLTEHYEGMHKKVFAPSKLAGRLETSKLWAKQFMLRNDIPTAKWETYDRSTIEEAIIRPNDKFPIVIKEDGLCGGKGVSVCVTLEEAINVRQTFTDNKFDSKSNKILIEEFIQGEEASCFVLTDGKDYKVLPYCQDHKRVGERDTGPNTGGMGAYAPAPLITDELDIRIRRKIIEPTLEGMREEGIPYRGILYIGLMICSGDPYVIEYNVRFGDPECQVLMMLMESDLSPYLEACVEGTLKELPAPKFYKGSAITVCMCSGGYPEKYGKGFPIEGLDKINDPDVQVFHAGTQKVDDRYITKGGRVLNVTARGETLQEAQDKAYQICKKIHWEDSFYRKDIGYKAL